MRCHRNRPSALGIGLLLYVTALGGAARADEPTITEQSAFSFYKTLSLLTPKPIFVSRRLVAACTAPSLSAYEEERRRAGPHADTMVNLYANDIAKKAIEAKARRFPTGAVIVKEKFEHDAAATAVGGMVKRAPGFDPAHGDWEYFYAVRSGGFASGRLSTCIGCHRQAKSDDYVFSLVLRSAPSASSPATQ